MGIKTRSESTRGASDSVTKKTRKQVKDTMFKFVHNAFALIVSVAMVCTLTPATALARGGSVGASGSFDSGSSGSTEIGVISEDSSFAIDPNSLKFADGSAVGSGDVTSPLTYTNTQAFLDTINKNIGSSSSPEYNSMQVDIKGMPEDYIITWRITELNPVDNKPVTDSGGNPVQFILDSYSSDGLDVNGNPLTNSSAYPLSSLDKNGEAYVIPCPINANGTFSFPGNIKNDGTPYEISVTVMNKGMDPDDPGYALNSSRQIKTYVAFSDKYKADYLTPSTLNGESVPTNSHPEYSIHANLYESGGVVPQLETHQVDKSSNPYTKLESAAADDGKLITEAAEMSLYSTGNPYPTDATNQPYSGGATIRVPVPSNLPSDYEIDTSGDVPVLKLYDSPLSSGDITIYAYDPRNPTGAPKEITGTLGWAPDPNDPTKDYVDPNTGERIPVISFEITGTSTELGTFAVGVASNTDTYTINASVADNSSDKTDGFGFITPTTRKGMLGDHPVTLKAFAFEQGSYVDSWTVKVGNTTLNVDPADIGYNTITINASKYNGVIVKDSVVNVEANFRQASNSGAESTFTVHVVKEDGSDADGEVAITSIKSGVRRGISMGGSDSVSIPAGTGALLNFTPKAGSMVKSIYQTMPGGVQKNIGFASTELMLGGITSDMDITVVFAKGSSGSLADLKVTSAVGEFKDAPSGTNLKIPATITTGKDPETQGFGLSRSFTLSSNINFKAYSMEITVGGQGGAEKTIIQRSDENPNGSDLFTTSKDDASSDKNIDSCTIYNIVENLDILFIYEAADGKLSDVVNNGGIVDGGGSGGPIDWNKPGKRTRATNSATRTSTSVGATLSVSANTEIASDAIRNTTSVNALPGGSGSGSNDNGGESGSVTPPSGSSGSTETNTGEIGLNCTVSYTYAANPGYTLGSYKINGDEHAIDYLTEREMVYVDSEGNELSRQKVWTITIYRGEIPDDFKDDPDFVNDMLSRDYTQEFSDGNKRWYYTPTDSDRAYVILEPTISSEMNFIPDQIPVDSYYTISTSVTEYGNGAITPSRSVVPGDDARVEFFPNDGYKLETVWVDGIPIADDSPYWDKSNPNSLAIKFTSVNASHKVRVAFAPGDDPYKDKTRFTINASCSLGGSITPSGEYSIYENSPETFTLIPGTGFILQSLLVDDQEVKDQVSNNTYKINKVTHDMKVYARFVSAVPNDNDTYRVSTRVSSVAGVNDIGASSISPTGPVNVAAGSSMTFTFVRSEVKDQDGNTRRTYVSDVLVYYGEGATNGSSMMQFVRDNTLTFDSVTSDMLIEVIYSISDADGSYPGSSTNPVPDIPDTFTLDDDQVVVDPSSDKPGANIQPSASDITLIKDGDHSKTPLDFTLTVAEGYELEGIYINNKNVDTDGSSSGVTYIKVADGVYSIHVPADLVKKGSENFELKATTKPTEVDTVDVDTRTITIKVTGEGTVSPGATTTKEGSLKVEAGRGETFYFTPAAGHDLLSVYLNGTQINNINNYQYSVQNVVEDSVLEVVFSELQEGETQPTLPVDRAVNFTIEGNDTTDSFYPSLGPVMVHDGGNLSILAIPGDGKKVSVSVSGLELPHIGNTFQLNNITSDINVLIKFMPDVEDQYCNFTVTGSEHGTVSPEGTQLVPADAPQTITMIPDPGYYIESITINGVPYDGIVSPDMSITLDPDDLSPNTKVEVKFTDDPNKRIDKDYPDDQKLPDSSELTYHKVESFIVGGKGGSVIPTENTVANGGSVTISMIPQVGYMVRSVLVDGSAVSAVAPDIADAVLVDSALVLSNINKDKRVEVTFERINSSQIAPYYTVVTSVMSNSALTNNGGTISPLGANTVAGGGNFSLSIMPEQGCKISRIIVEADGRSTTTPLNNTWYTLFNVTADTNLIVVFEAGQGSSTITHDLTASATFGGQVSPTGTIKVADRADSYITFIPDTGYTLSYVTIDNKINIRGSDIINNQYRFAGVAEDHTLLAVYCESSKIDTYKTINVAPCENGQISPSGSVVVDTSPTGGATQEFVITGYYGYGPSTITLGVGTGPSTFPDITNLTLPQSGTLGNTGVSYTWDPNTSTLTVSGIKDDMSLIASFEQTGSNGGTGNATTFTPVTGVTTSGSGGASGEVALEPDGYTQDPVDWNESTVPTTGDGEKERFPHVNVAPDGEDSMIDEILIKYGDGSKTVIASDGTYEYDPDGNLLDGPYPGGNVVTPNVKYPDKGPNGGANMPSSSQTTADVYEQGYFTYDAEHADNAGRVDMDISFRPKTSAEQSLQKPKYYNMNVTHTGGGRVIPKGNVKVADTKDNYLPLQILPDSGFEILTVTIDGKDVTSSVSPTRKIFVPADGDHDVHVVFTYVNNRIYKNITANVSGGGGTVSPESVTLAAGSFVTINFYPDEGKVIDHLRVKGANSTDKDYSGAWTERSYTLNNVQDDFVITVTYRDGTEEDNVWPSPETVELKSRVGAASAELAHGKVTPASQQVPINTGKAVYFEPDDGYVVDYVIFNGVTTKLYNNPAYVVMTPVKGQTGEDANTVIVYFKSVIASDQEFVTITPNIANNQDHASIDPSSQTVPVGDSCDFVIHVDRGWTVDKVNINGVTVDVRPAVPEGTAVNPNASYSDYIIHIDEAQVGTTVNVTIKPTPDGQEFIEITKHRLTVNGSNALTLRPLGDMQLPEGVTVKIYSQGLSGYFLDSIEATEFDNNGAQIGLPTDLTTSINNSILEYTMGTHDTTIFYEYLPVGDGPISFINAAISSATLLNEDGTTTPLNLVSNRINFGSTKNGSSVIGIPMREGDGMLLGENGEPMEFIRGGSYMFFVSGVSDNNENLVLKSAKYNGNDLNVLAGYNTISDVLMNVTAGFDLVFKVGEPLDPETRSVNAKALNDGVGGTISIAGSVPNADGSVTTDVLYGGTSNRIYFQPESEYYMIYAVYEYRVDNEGAYLMDSDGNFYEAPDGHGNYSMRVVPPEEYSSGWYECREVYSDVYIRVDFTDAMKFAVHWDKDAGFITPNPSAGTEYLQLARKDQSLSFVIAPYENHYVDEVNLTTGAGENAYTDEITGQITQSIEYANVLINGYDGAEVLAISEGMMGAVTPDNEGEATNTVPQGEMNELQALAKQAYFPTSIASTNGTQPVDNPRFARAYGVEIPLQASDGELEATFFTAQDNPLGTYTISSNVQGNGQVLPSGTITLPAGAVQAFQFIPDEGYIVSSLKVDGGDPDMSSVGQNGYSYVFTNIDRDHTLDVTFEQYTGQDNWFDRLVKTAAGLAKTGDLMGPAIGLFVLLVGAGVAFMVISAIRSKRREQE